MNSQKASLLAKGEYKLGWKIWIAYKKLKFCQSQMLFWNKKKKKKALKYFDFFFLTSHLFSQLNYEESTKHSAECLASPIEIL